MPNVLASPWERRSGRSHSGHAPWLGLIRQVVAAPARRPRLQRHRRTKASYAVSSPGSMGFRASNEDGPGLPGVARRPSKSRPKSVAGTLPGSVHLDRDLVRAAIVDEAHQAVGLRDAIERYAGCVDSCSGSGECLPDDDVVQGLTIPVTHRERSPVRG
jgi:hypothetical protein